jgi:flagellin
LTCRVISRSVNTTFNETVLVTGATFSFFADINVTGTEIITTAIQLAASQLTVSATDVSLLTVVDAQSAINDIDNAISTIAEKRGIMGAISNRMDHIIDNLTNVVANTVSAQSRIQDADYAVETTALTRATILQQAATSMIAQANANKNSITQLKHKVR